LEPALTKQVLLGPLVPLGIYPNKTGCIRANGSYLFIHNSVPFFSSLYKYNLFFFYPEDGSRRFFHCVGIYLPCYNAS